MKVCVAGSHSTDLASDRYVRTRPGLGRTEFRMTVDFSELAHVLSPLDEDLAELAAGLFKCESLLHDGGIELDEDLTFVVCQRKLRHPGVARSLSDIVSFTMHRMPRIRFRVSSEKCSDGNGEVGKALRSVCLFSGGIDSLSGILNIPFSLQPTVGAFVSHDRMAPLVRRVQDHVLKEKGIAVHKIVIQRGHRGFQQMRGFTYLIMGAVVAKINCTNNIVISETGQTMFLPPIAALDEITVTTHPTLIEVTKSLLRDVYGIGFNIIEPFSDLTKAEVISLCEAKSAIPFTNSCITSQFANQTYSHCGKCHGCLVRRVGCLVAGAQDANYAKDVLVWSVGDEVMGNWPGRLIQKKDVVELQALLRFSRDVIEGRLDEDASMKISLFSKEELFRRAALDVLSALYLLYDRTKRGHNDIVRRFYEECKKDGLVTSDIAENRISEVRERKYKPDFTTML